MSDQDRDRRARMPTNQTPVTEKPSDPIEGEVPDA
jgi:hypothetical protein